MKKILFLKVPCDDWDYQSQETHTAGVVKESTTGNEYLGGKSLQIPVLLPLHCCIPECLAVDMSPLTAQRDQVNKALLLKPRLFSLEHSECNHIYNSAN